MNRFDPLKHKRGAGGKFADMLRNLKPGSAVELPDGIHVKAGQSRVGGKQRRGYTVHDPGGKQAPGFHLEAQTAAVAALNHSARHEHPDAVGGKKKFTSYEAAIGGEPPLKGARPVAASLPHGEGGGQGHAKNLDDVRKSFDPDPMKARQQINNSKLPQFQKRELLIKVQREIAAKKDATGRIAPEPVAPVKGAKADDKPKRDVAGPADKPKAGDLKAGETKLNHSTHGDMVYMGRNATNHHIAAKADDLGGKKHIIRLKEISLGHKQPTAGEQHRADREELAKEDANMKMRRRAEAAANPPKGRAKGGMSKGKSGPKA